MQPKAQLQLVVVDGFPEPTQPGNHDWTLPVGNRGHDRSDAGVRDDDARAANCGGKLVVRQIVDADGARWPDRGRPVLDDKRFVGWVRLEGVQQAVEARLIRPHRHEDHLCENTLPA